MLERCFLQSGPLWGLPEDRRDVPENGNAVWDWLYARALDYEKDKNPNHWRKTEEGQAMKMNVAEIKKQTIGLRAGRPFGWHAPTG